MIRAQEQSALYGIPNLTYRMPGGVGGGFNHHLDRDDGEQPGVALVCHRRAQPEGRVSGRLQQSEPDLSVLQRGHLRAAEQRRAESAHAGDHDERLAGAHQGHPEPVADVVLRAGSVDAQSADAAGRHPVRLLPDELSRVEDRWPGLHRHRPAGNRVSVALDAAGQMEGRHAARGRRLRPVRRR